MANLGQTFDANAVDPADSFEPLPAGDYMVVITDSEMKDTRSGTGQYLQLTLQVVDGPYHNRLIFDRLNLINPNQTAVEIAQRQLSQICHAVGILSVTDSAQLHNLPLVAKIAYRNGNDQYGPSNDVKGYRAADDAPKSKQASATASKPAPWAR